MLQALPIEQLKAGMLQRGGRRHVVLVQHGDEPIVQARHRDLAGVQRFEQVTARFAGLVELECVAVRFVFHDDPAAAVAERVGQDAELLDAVRFVINGSRPPSAARSMRAEGLRPNPSRQRSR